MHASTRHIMYVRISVKFFLDAWAFAACGFSKAWQLYTTYATQQLDFCCKKKLLHTSIISLLLGAIFQVLIHLSAFAIFRQQKLKIC